MTEVQPAPVEDDVPAPPLKKRATKRGLCSMVNAAPADEPATESHNVYSSCVAQSFSNFHRKPLFSKQCNRNTKIPSGQLLPMLLLFISCFSFCEVFRNIAHRYPWIKPMLNLKLQFGKWAECAGQVSQWYRAKAVSPES